MVKNTKFASRISELRKEKRMTQREFADYLNLSSGTIALYETGDRTPSFGKLVELADKLNVNYDYLLGNTDTRTIVLRDYDDMPRNQQELLGLIEELDPKHVDAVVAFIKTIQGIK